MAGRAIARPRHLFAARDQIGAGRAVEAGEIHRYRRDRPRAPALPHQQPDRDDAQNDQQTQDAQRPDHAFTAVLAVCDGPSSVRPGVFSTTARTAW